MRIRLLALILIAALSSQAQLKDDNLTENFAFYVKSIDDFFDRFNFTPYSSFQNYLQTNYSDKKITRRKMIASLFNANSNLLVNQKAEINELIVEVTDSAAPEYLNYNDNKWYAQLNCRIRYNNKPKALTLILKVENLNQRQFWWSLVSANADFLKSTTVTDTAFDHWKKNNPPSLARNKKKYFLTPVSHGIDFINVDEVFNNEQNAGEYVYVGEESEELKKLLYLIEGNKIKFEYVETVSYHLLELENWILVVDYFNRNNRNSGWLINSMLKVTNKQKEQYLVKYLNIPLSESKLLK